MSAPFVSELRTGDDVLTIPGNDAQGMHLRVQVAELWDAVKVMAPSTAAVATVKNAALVKFFPDGVNPGDFVAKVRGFEILHEQESLESSGIRDGSTILLHRRRRRPVK